MVRPACLCLALSYAALGLWVARLAADDVTVTQDVDVTVRVNVENDSRSVVLSSPQVPRERIPLLFESTYALKTSQRQGQFLRTFSDSTLPGLEEDQVIELLYQGCSGDGTPHPRTGAAAQRGDLHLWVRRHDNYSTSRHRGRWGQAASSVGEPYRLDGLSEVLSLSHPTIFRLGEPANCGQVRSLLCVAQDCGWKFVAVIREIRVDFMNPSLPPTMAEFTLDVWLGVFPASTMVVGPF